MRRQHVVAAIVILVAVWDVAVGLFILLGPSPHLANGPGTIWARAPETLGPESDVVFASLFARIGAFSLHVGIVTIAWCAIAWRDRRAMGVLLVIYLVSGVTFFAGDLRYFSGTPYFLVKQVFGALWAFALVLHFWPWRAMTQTGKYDL